MQTYFNGTVLQSEIVASIVATIAVILILLLAKKIFKIILTVIVIVVCLIYFGVVSPSQLKDVSTVISEKGQEVIEQISSTSQNVKIINEDGLDVQVFINDTWVSVDDISSFVKSDDIYTVIIGSESYEVADKGIQKMLDLFKK